MIKVDKDEMLRYLGHKGQTIDEGTEQLINEAITVVEKMKPRFVFQVFNITRKNNAVIVEGTNLILRGTSIYKHLEKSEKVVLMAVTLGTQIEDIIRKLNYTDMAAGMIYDACASSMVESVCDYVETQIKALHYKEGYHLTYRFSPGYGDLDLEVQSKFVAVLKATKKIGLHVSDTNILMPRKSVTAIIGLQKEGVEKSKKKCDTCMMRATCSFAKKGEGHETC